VIISFIHIIGTMCVKWESWLIHSYLNHIGVLPLNTWLMHLVLLWSILTS